MHAPVAGLHVPDQPLLPAHRQAGVALQSGQQLARRRVKAAALQVDDRPFAGRAGAHGAASSSTQAASAGSYSPAIARRGELSLHQLAADRGIEPVEADRQPGMLAGALGARR